jgi:hypothetical protein
LSNRDPRPQLTVTTITTPLPLNSDCNVDYYAILSLSIDATSDAINYRFWEKSQLYSPHTTEGAKRWFSPDPSIRREVRKNWYNIKKAYNVLSDTNLRARYNECRTAGGPQSPHAPGPTQDPQVENLPDEMLRGWLDAMNDDPTLLSAALGAATIEAHDAERVEELYQQDLEFLRVDKEGL